MTDKQPVHLGKGRPTPKRGSASRGPVQPPPKTRKEAAQRLRAQQADGRKGVRAGYVAGDESKLLPRDRGPVRRTIRDVVDSRRNVGVLLLPLAILVVAASLVDVPALTRLSNTIWTAAMIAVIIDALLLGFRVSKALKQHHPDERKGGRHIGYALLRSTVLRRFRMPPPQVSPGDTV